MNKRIRVILMASIVALAMVMSAAIGAPDTMDLSVSSCSIDDADNTDCYTAVLNEGGTTYALGKGKHMDAYISDLSVQSINSVVIYYKVSGTLSGTWTIEGTDGHDGTVLCTKTGEESESMTLYSLECPEVDTQSELNNLVVKSTNDDNKRPESITFDWIYVYVDYTPSTPDTTPPTWDTTIGIQSATDTGNGGEVMVTYGTATDADSPPVKYNVYYNTSSPATGTGCTEISDVGPSPYTVTGLTNGQQYYFAVRAEDSATPPNEDTNTVELDATPTAPPPIPPTPYIVYGYVFYNDSTACNGPVVNVTNLNKNETWQAETNASYHYYELILDSFDLSATDTLEFDAKDPDATQFNTTDHTVTQTELNNGGLFNFNLTLHPPAGVNDTAWAEETVKGEVIGGNFIYTHESDGDYEVIEEESTVGKPSTRISSLEHKWTINVTGGSKVTFHLQAHRIDMGDEGDDFMFAYWNGSDYVPMVTVNTLGDTNLSYEMPPTTSGSVSIRVTDTDKTPGKYSKATIHIDHMYIRSEP